MVHELVKTANTADDVIPRNYGLLPNLPIYSLIYM